MADEEPRTDLEGAEIHRREQREAAQRDRQEALKAAAQDAGVYRAELLEAGFDEDEAIRLVEHMQSWYWEMEPPWAS